MTPGPVSEDRPTPRGRRSIEQLRELQSERRWTFIHLVEFDEHGWTLAHTDTERATIAPEFDGCAIQEWLQGLDGIPVEQPGVYVFAKREHDPTSESFRSDTGPWELVPIDQAQPRPPQTFACRR